MQTNIENQIVEAIQDKKGKKIAIIDFSGIETAPSEKFIICEGNSTSQVSALADSVRDSLEKNLHLKAYNYDGYKNSQWIVIDYGNVMVHVFLKDIRNFYNLEELWNDGTISMLEDLD